MNYDILEDVLDPMVGSGTTVKMAKANNRNFFGIDINEEYVNLAKKRIENVFIYNLEHPNPKSEFLLSKKSALENRKYKKNEINL